MVASSFCFSFAVMFGTNGEAAIDAAEKSGLPSVIHVKFDAEGITPTTTLSALRKKALGA